MAGTTLEKLEFAPKKRKIRSQNLVLKNGKWMVTHFTLTNMKLNPINILSTGNAQLAIGGVEILSFLLVTPQRRLAVRCGPK